MGQRSGSQGDQWLGRPPPAPVDGLKLVEKAAAHMKGLNLQAEEYAPSGVMLVGASPSSWEGRYRVTSEEGRAWSDEQGSGPIGGNLSEPQLLVGSESGPACAEASSEREASVPFQPRMRLARICLNCGELHDPSAAQCGECGRVFRPSDGLRPVWADRGTPILPLNNTTLGGKFRVLAYLGQPTGVGTYLVSIESQGQSAAAILRAIPVEPEPPAAPAPPSLDSSGDQDEGDKSRDTLLPNNDDVLSATAVLLREARVLAHCKSPILPKMLDHSHEPGLRYLVETAAFGRPMLEAWRDPTVPLVRKLEWLEELRQALVELHDLRVIFPSLEPIRLVVDDENRLHVTDVSGLLPFPTTEADRSEFTLYSAPDLLAPGRPTDARSDAYTFGTVLCALHLGRDLREDDFEYRGTPRPLHELLPDGLPPLLRLLGKTFVGRWDHRFPLPDTPKEDPTGFESIREALAEYAAAALDLRYEIAGWSSVGMLRENNEDAFTISHLSGGAQDYRREIALICVADGMGGHASGEVASALAVSRVAEFLRNRGLSSAQLHRLGQSHPFDNADTATQLLEDAVRQANQDVFETSMQEAKRPLMGCTLEAVLLVGEHAIVCHVGDSRVYHRRGASLTQITRDQTLVSHLVELGHLTPAQAAVHPRRSELFQAVGTHSDLMLKAQRIDLIAGDWLVICTDGVTGHVANNEIVSILASSESAEQASRRLVNLANAHGGKDNSTAVVVRIM